MNLIDLAKILFWILVNSTNAAANVDSCREQIQNYEWPTDCLLGLKISETQSTHIHYQNLDTWCALNSKHLSKKSPPKVFMKLSAPPTCLKIAKERLKQQKVLLLIKGEFLNSFL